MCQYPTLVRNTCKATGYRINITDKIRSFIKFLEKHNYQRAKLKTALVRNDLQEFKGTGLI